VNVLVVGGTRFIGVATVDRLLERGHAVTLFNRGSRAGLWGGRVRELHGDRRESLAPLAHERFDAVLDFCAYTARDTEALLGVQGEVQRLVHLSSGTVYALDPHLPWREDTPLGPAELWGDYARGKIDCERALARRPPSVATTIVRLPWVLGPRSYADREAFVFNRLLDAEEVLLPGDGKALQQFVSAAQVAHALVAIVERFETGLRALNVASPGYASLEGFVALCAQVAGVEPRLTRVGGGPTGTGAATFAITDCVFPFPNENYLLDLAAAADAGVAPPPADVEQVLAESLEWLRSDPARRRWRRTPAETAALRALARRD